MGIQLSALKNKKMIVVSSFELGDNVKSFYTIMGPDTFSRCFSIAGNKEVRKGDYNKVYLYLTGQVKITHNIQDEENNNTYTPYKHTGSYEDVPSSSAEVISPTDYTTVRYDIDRSLTSEDFDPEKTTVLNEYLTTLNGKLIFKVRDVTKNGIKLFDDNNEALHKRKNIKLNDRENWKVVSFVPDGSNTARIEDVRMGSPDMKANWLSLYGNVVGSGIKKPLIGGSVSSEDYVEFHKFFSLNSIKKLINDANLGGMVYELNF